MLQVDPSHFLGPSSYDRYILVILFCLKHTKRNGPKICRNKEIMYKSCKLVLFGSVHLLNQTFSLNKIFLNVILHHI